MPDTKNNAREFHRLWHAVDRAAKSTATISLSG